MKMWKIADPMKSFVANKALAKGYVDHKICNGLLKIIKSFREMTVNHGCDSSDLDDFYGMAPANLKLFKATRITDVISDMQKIDYIAQNVEAVKLDIYRKIMWFLAINRLTQFYLEMKSAGITVANESGVSGAVFKRIKLVEDIVDESFDDRMNKRPDRATLIYIEMGLKRMISMEVGTDDWDK